ncbi:hypothetical protein GCM10023148_44870 [Actinokineospora soli]
MDEERRLEAHVSCAFLARAAVDERIATYLREGHVQGHAFLAGQIARVDPDGADREASALPALATGFAFTVPAGQCSPADALAGVDAKLTALFG